MAEQDRIERLNEAVDALFAGRRAPSVDPELAMLLVIVADLHGLPDPAFKTRLKGELMPTTITPTVETHTMTPYLIARDAPALIAFLERAFGGREMFRAAAPDGRIMHAVVNVGDSPIELGEAPADYPPRHFALHLYVDDADAVYQRALDAGATSIRGPVDQPYLDREATVGDRFGNEWYIATRTVDGPKPKGFRSVTPFFHARNAPAYVEFLEDAFGATEGERYAGPDGTILHTILRIGDSVMELGEAHGKSEPVPMAFHLQVDDADAVYARALRAGATSVEPPQDKPYGERVGWVVDSNGTTWFIATAL